MYCCFHFRMALTAAERQRACREKKRAEMGDEAFRERERKRKRSSYTPVPQLSTSERESRRAKGRAKSAKQRQKKNSREPLVVKLPYLHKTAVARRKRISRAVSSANRSIKKLVQKKETLETKVKTLQKRNSRMQSKLDAMKTVVKRKRDSPRSRAREILQSCKLSPREYPIVFKQLTAYNAMMAEVRVTYSTVQNKQKLPLTRVLSGRITKKYRLHNKLSKDTGISRHR